MQGLPAKLLAVVNEKPPYYIVARPGIKSVMELRGKKIAAQQRGLSDRVAAKRFWNQKGSISKMFSSSRSAAICRCV